MKNYYLSGDQVRRPPKDGNIAGDIKRSEQQISFAEIKNIAR